jgi:hypothetical protein
MGERGTSAWHCTMLHLRKTTAKLDDSLQLLDTHAVLLIAFVLLHICPTPGDGGLQPRDIPLRGGRTALLFVDTQNFNCHRDGTLGSQILVSAQQARRHSVVSMRILWH